jgi:3',5'-cyclic AMP phosphodiesterase CpdA
MSNVLERRDLLKLIGVGGVFYASGMLAACSSAGRSPSSKIQATAGSQAIQARGASDDFFFMQLSDTHWGFTGDAVNPHPGLELKSAVAAINSVATKPDFVVFTGDLTHTTDDVDQRRTRMTEFKQIVADLQVPLIKFMPGEHDAAPDVGAVYVEQFGDMHYSFDHKGIHFIALDNVSDPMALVGADQLAWLKADLAALDRDAPIVVFTHRPLWDLKPEWDWTTADGADVIAALMVYTNVTVFFGHIHQELHHMTGHIAHHAARSLMFALPTPQTPGTRTPVPWDSAQPEQGLGYRSVEAKTEVASYALTEIPQVVPEASP